MRRFDLLAVVALAGLTVNVGCAAETPDEVYETSSAGLLSTEQQHALRTRASSRKLQKVIEASDAKLTSKKDQEAFARIGAEVDKMVDAADHLVRAVGLEGGIETQTIHPTYYGPEDGVTPSYWYGLVMSSATAIEGMIGTMQADAAAAQQLQAQMTAEAQKQAAERERLVAEVKSRIVDLQQDVVVNRTKTAQK